MSKSKGQDTAGIELPGGGVQVADVPGMSRADAAAAAARSASQAADQAARAESVLEARLAAVKNRLAEVGDASAQSNELAAKVQKLEAEHLETVANTKKRLLAAREEHERFHYSADTQSRIVERRKLLKEQADIEATIRDMAARA